MDTPYGKADTGPDPKLQCPFCEQRYGLIEALALTELCEHGHTPKTPREFADVGRVQTLPDGRTLVILERSEPFEGRSRTIQTVLVVTKADAERLRVALGRSGAAAMVERWRA